MTAKPKVPPAPKHLRPATRLWWAHVVGHWALEEHHLRLFQLAAAAWDRAQQAREVVDREGVVVVDRFKQRKPHPAVMIERDAPIVFARLLRELDLDTVAPPEAPRPPGRE